MGITLASVLVALLFAAIVGVGFHFMARQFAPAAAFITFLLVLTVQAGLLQ